MDSFKQGRNAAEFNKLALGEPTLISAVTGAGTGDLLDMVVKKIGTKPAKSSTLHIEKSPTEISKKNRYKICKKFYSSYRKKPN